MQTLPDYVTNALSKPRPRAFAERLGEKEWRFTSSREMLERASSIASALRFSGLDRGDRVALIADNRVDWLTANFGTLLAGCVVVPIFATLAYDQMDFIFVDSGAKLAFVESPAMAERIRKHCPNAPRMIVFDGQGSDSLATFEAGGAMNLEKGRAVLAGFTESIAPSDLAVLIYTSGTTGNPKGVMLSHNNLTSNAIDTFAEGFDEMQPDDSVLSVLPFAHVYEFIDALGVIQFDWRFYITRPEYLVDDLKSVRPALMAMVPRIFERLLAALYARAKAEGGLKAKLVPWALGIGREYAEATVDGAAAPVLLSAKYALAQRLVLSKIKPMLGLDRVRGLASGSAPLHRDIALTFAGLGIPISEGYGLTETSPVVTASRLGALRYGSVGRPIANVQVKIADDGEILVKGPNVILGYYNLPDEHPFTADGWFMTGDVGRLDSDGYLYITDRKKELIKTSAGKYVAPGRVESALKRSSYIAQVLVVGDGRPFPAALISPNWDLVRTEFSIPADVPTVAISQRTDVEDFIRKEATEMSADLATFEQIRRIALLPRDLTIEDGELSPTLKVKRRVVESRYADLVERAYAERELVKK
jgi:long-chain acyl-CoA synthetase